VAHACTPPPDALHRHYADEGGYVDCYAARFAGRVALPEFVEAFYTTWLFRLERWILARVLSLHSTDAQARQVAAGELDRFAAWSVEARAPGQLLMCDFQKRTRSWFMVAPCADEDGTRLHFGSVVVPVTDARTGARRMGPAYRALLGFHRLYSRALLHAAIARLRRRRR
jgi:hypothetical protein